MTSPVTLIWYLVIVSALLNLILYLIFRDRYLYGVMVIAFRLIEKDPVLCKVRAQPPVGPIEDVCIHLCIDYGLCEKMGRR